MEGRARRCSIRPTGSARLEAVLRAEAYVRAHPDAPVSQLSRVVGLSERGLRAAFYRVRGMSPKRSTLTERLRRVRRALTDPRESGVTVTGAAADFGFYELGRFAGTYRKAFGEAPSDTLRSTGRRREATSHGERTRQCLQEQET
jgi:AraC family ethanolamine operon transcriptional activator